MCSIKGRRACPPSGVRTPKTSKPLTEHWLRSVPRLTAADTPRNQRILKAMPSLREVYRPLGFLLNGHVETIWAALFRRGAGVSYYRRCVTMPDGGVVALDFEHHQDVRV